MTMFEEMKKLFTEIIGETIINNEHLATPLFHTFLGSILTTPYLSGAKNKSLRIHLVIIQSSGSGKSEAMKALRDLADFVGIKVIFGVRYTEAGLTGTWEKVKGVGNKIKLGILHDYRIIIWDEGSVIFEDLGPSFKIRDVLNTACDDPGQVCKTLRLGPIEYKTNTVIIIGTIPIQNINESLFVEGFMYRFYISYKIFNETELKEIDNKLLDLKSKSRKRLNMLFEDFKRMVEEVKKNEEMYNESAIKFDMSYREQMQEEKDRLWHQFFESKFTDRKKELIRSAYSRLGTLIDKLAAQHAVVEAKTHVDIDSYRYACLTVEFHCKSVLTLLNQIPFRMSIIEKKKLTIKEIVSRKPGINQKGILEQLTKMAVRGMWDMGVNNSRELLKEMVEDKEIRCERGPHGSYQYHND